jgi:hypothetical protein
MELWNYFEEKIGKIKIITLTGKSSFRMPVKPASLS